ncbi:hypothetical protein BGZ76_009340 [Entomortierella beljakovae]|nr:hypothetical protein BGZ76_009340 [Entomortierella beljakovae]
MQRGCSQTIPSRHSTHAREQKQQPCMTGAEHHEGCRPLNGIGICENGNFMMSNKGGSPSARDAILCNKYIEMNVLPILGRGHSTDESHCKSTFKNTTDHFAQVENKALWSYRQLVNRVVLNFSHPQSSPELLVKTLECIGTRCHDQIQAFDLHANEKMQAAGLEIPSELRRLFKLGFSKLRYLRLQGGLIDNQVFGALVSGLTEPPMATCRLSHVFLGPGSITDSSIDKLINAAGHCLEVFAVTSCVDVSGGALASLLTSCPKLRVLSVHRSIAKDKELLERLGIETESNLPVSPALVAPLSSVTHKSPQKEIIAPLERLELGMVKFTDVGVAAIIKGTSATLRFLVLEMQHFKDDLLKHTIAPLCKKLEGLYFVEPDHLPQQQRQQALHDHGLEEQRVRRRFFEIRRNRRSLESQQQQHRHLRNYGHQTFDHRNPRLGQVPRQSPWLGETTTDEWVLYGDCALWAASTVGSTVAPRHDNVLNAMDLALENQLAEQSRARSFTAYFRALSRRIVSMISTGNTASNAVGNDAGIAEEPEDNTAAAIDSETTSFPENNDYESLLLRFGVDPKTIVAVVDSLQPSLQSFTALQTDVIQANIDWVEKYPDSTDVTLSHDCQRDGLETFLRLVVLLGALVFGAAVSVSIP